MRVPRPDVSRLRRPKRPGLRRLDPSTLLMSLGRSGLTVRALTDGAWLVQRPSPDRRGLRVKELESGGWVLQEPGPLRRKVRSIGSARLRTDLVVDETAVRENMAAHQRAMLHYLGEEHIAWMLRSLDVNCVLDVGANRGQYGRRLRRAGYTGRIVSFEPIGHVADFLERRAAKDPDWKVVRCALGDVNEETEIGVAGGQARMSSLLPPSDFGKGWAANLRNESAETISVRRLEELYDEAVAGIDDPRVYLKLDTQGYDLKAFAGAGDKVKDVVGMQSEVSSVQIYDGMPEMTEQLEVYKAAGFEITGMFPVIVDGPTLRVIEFDAIMIRTSALAG